MAADASRRMASRPDSTVGPVSVGRTATHRPGAAGCGLSSQLVAVPGAAAKRVDSPIGAALVFCADSFSGLVVLLLAVQGPETDTSSFPALRARLRPGRLYGDQQLAPNAQWRGLDAAGDPVFSARYARRAPRLKRSVVRRFSRRRIPERPPSDSD